MISPGFQPALLALQAGGVGSMTPFIFQIAAIFGIFYFLLIRPQQKQKRKHEEALRSIKRGDQVVTTGGIIGEVVHVRETVNADGTTARPMEDQVTIKSAESRLIVERGRIAKIVSGAGAATKE
jgi:preprotein translocase subunit YajC